MDDRAVGRLSLARWYGRRALWGVLERFPNRSSLIVLNYHRIGTASTEPFDSGVFSVTPEQLAAHADFLKSHYNVLDLEGAIRATVSGQWPRRSSVLITFDDGYRDNYDVAFPILAARGLPATFFLVSTFVGSSELPWWDSIAYIVKNSKRLQFAIRYPAAATFDLTKCRWAG